MNNYVFIHYVGAFSKGECFHVRAEDEKEAALLLSACVAESHCITDARVYDNFSNVKGLSPPTIKVTVQTTIQKVELFDSASKEWKEVKEVHCE